MRLCLSRSKASQGPHAKLSLVILQTMSPLLVDGTTTEILCLEIHRAGCPLLPTCQILLTLTGNRSGNNVITFIGRPDQTTKKSVEGTHQFKYFYNANRSPRYGQNPDAARTGAFYTSNVVHDIAYRYGFTEKAFNFQSNNFGKGGEDGDLVLVSVHNDSGTNDAAFCTPPDCVKSF